MHTIANSGILSDPRAAAGVAIGGAAAMSYDDCRRVQT